MSKSSRKTWPIMGACSVILAVSSPAFGETPNHPSRASDASVPSGTTTGSSDAARDAVDHVNDAVKVMHRMQAEPGMATLLQQARGIFVIPEYGRVALGVGGRGGAGVLLFKKDGNWSEPLFYNYGGVSAGLQAGGEGGAIAFVLNNDKAVNSFTKQGNNWSLNADAGLTVVAWSKRGQASAGKGDVTAWSDTKGLFGDLAISLTDINFDEDETGAYYGHKVASAQDVINGNMSNPHSAALKQALSQMSMAGEREGRR